MSFFNPVAIIAILIGLTVHEWSHAFVASRLGDPTAHNQGRLTLNPIAHIDPMGALLFLTIGFGWAKPVPVNPFYFNNPKQGMMLTAIAGPLSNLILAFLAYLGLLLLGGPASSVWSFLSIPATGPVAVTFFLQLFSYSLFVNLGMMAFNLLPIGPLDGSNVLHAFIPLSLEDRYADYLRVGPFILLAVLLGESFLGIQFFSTWITVIMDFVLRVFLFVTGRI